MPSTEQLSLIKQGVKQWNDWRKNNSLIPVDLSNADLRQLDLAQVTLWDANLQGANLAQANLTKSDLRGANLTKANLSGANLAEADLRNANFTQANLSQAILEGANLSGALLIQANLEDSNFNEAILTASCLDNCSINQGILLKNLTCNYIYFAPNKLNRFPETGNLEPGELVNILQKDFISVTTEPTGIESKSLEVFDQLSELNYQEVKQDNTILEKTAITIAELIEKVSVDLPESPTRHVKVATKVISLLQGNQEFLSKFHQLKVEDKLDELEVLIPNPAVKFIIIGLKK
ncbi:MAG: pentapeptide repeat-containing protein [Gloeocapsa sp. DLM2.Bin57]|nr:MAG: pentapeptide repeat-containing protein [Gloeocapsa sp. DLM2.Bin57]